MNKKIKNAFTLIELLVVISIIAMLLSILMPSLSNAREQAKEIICRSNIRQLYLANIGYANENSQSYVRAAPDIFSGFGIGGGKMRWHGVRQPDTATSGPTNKFDPTKGPLVGYLADGEVKKCPSFKHYEDSTAQAFEAGGGGFGYNSIGIGSRAYDYGFTNEAMRSSMRSTEIEKPFMKVMFTDTAFVQTDDSGKEVLVEYSFCESPKRIRMTNIGIIEYGTPIPSIHFRHDGQTNVIFADGHIESKTLQHSRFRDELLEKFPLGCFGPKDNSLFKPY